MGKYSLVGPELKKKIEQARNSEMSFAYCPDVGSKGAFSIDRQKDAKILGDKLKSETNGKQVGFGKVSIEGQVMSLTCEKKTVGDMAKKLKDLLKAEKVQLQVKILDPGGNALDNAKKAAKKIRDRINALADGNAKEQLTNALRIAMKQIDQGKGKEALDTLKKINQAIPSAAPSKAEPEDSIPSNAVNSRNPAELWAEARKRMRAEMKKLENEIVSVCSGVEGMEDAVEQAPRLTARLEVFGQELDGTLDAIVKTEEGPRRDKLKQDAKAQIKRFAEILKLDFFGDIDSKSKNGFADVAVAKTARESLKRIAGALA